MLAFVGIRFGIRADRASELHRVPVDLLCALVGTATIVLALLSPTLFVDLGVSSPWPWVTVLAAVAALIGFILCQRLAKHPLIDLSLFRRPSVATGLGYQAALGLATAGLGYTVTLQLQLAWGWPPVLAALGTLPQVLTMIGSVSAVIGLLDYALLGRYHYAFIAVGLVLVAAGMRIFMITTTINVMRGLPSDRTSIGAALNDTAQEVASGIGIAVVGMVVAASVSGALTGGSWSHTETAAFQSSVTVGVLLLTIAAVALLATALVRTTLARKRNAATSAGALRP